MLAKYNTKICVPSKTIYVKVKVFNMITNRIEGKTLVTHMSCDCKCKFDSTRRNLNQKWNNETCQCEIKNYRTCKKGYSWNPSTCIGQNSKHLRHIVDNSVITCDETMYIIHIVSTNVSINCDDKKARYKVECYILQTVLLVIILPLIIAIICGLYVKHRPKPNKTYSRTKNIKMENSEFKKISIKIVHVIILMT